MTRSIWLNENRRTLSGAGSSCGLEAGLMSAAASMGTDGKSIDTSVDNTSNNDGLNKENGYSTRTG